MLWPIPIPMTLASKITCIRIIVAPIYAVVCLMYGYTVAIHAPHEGFRLTAMALFATAALSDALDGWIARRFNQISPLGAFLDPLADKTLILTTALVLSATQWDLPNWHLPWWYTATLYTRELIIIFGVLYLQKKQAPIHFSPHWSGKICTATIFIALSWVMLKITCISPNYPCLLSAAMILFSTTLYICQGFRLLKAAKSS